MSLPIRIAALYCFTRFENCAELRTQLALACCSLGVKGTLLLAPEGINGTIAGLDAEVAHILEHVRGLPGCGALEVKESWTLEMPFHRMKVRVKREIVTMGEAYIDPLVEVGKYVDAAGWNALIDEPGTILIDTRNDYEVEVGTFAGAVNPETKTFREFPAWFRKHRDTLLGGGTAPKIAMFCTGGIRCEKATAFLRAEGLSDVYHLKGGILSYLEQVPVEESRWQGECFVFDERVAVGHGLAPGSHELCRGCRRPVSVEARTSGFYVQGVSCPSCHSERDERQRAGYAERHRQTQLAEARGEIHVGAVLPQRRVDVAE